MALPTTLSIVAVWELVIRLPGADDKNKEKFELTEMQPPGLGA
jgi:hypothetical protein